MLPPDVAATVSIGPPAVVADLHFDPYGAQTVTVNLPGVGGAGRIVTINSMASPSMGGDDPMSDPMIADLASRVGRLEAHVTTIVSDVSTVKERLTHMPTNAALWRAVAVSAGAVILSMLGIMQFLAKPWLQSMLDNIKP